eukprot:CAMPEP_0167767222 /NCGR_PEP_ID=MMETSP0110_2-20121227/15901_1 /TAXON_ID=629695 /ORGANISM="Gymnochlora sp., Strain CCMP2014" /LENGTH=62 /DNA_ID=CAMNT_0007655579 /DNA_START=374 /DNA_END=559 /DNA_ORIENTATION=+
MNILVKFTNSLFDIGAVDVVSSLQTTNRSRNGGNAIVRVVAASVKYLIDTASFPLPKGVASV